MTHPLHSQRGLAILWVYFGITLFGLLGAVITLNALHFGRMTELYVNKAEAFWAAEASAAEAMGWLRQQPSQVTGPSVALEAMNLVQPNGSFPSSYQATVTPVPAIAPSYYEILAAGFSGALDATGAPTGMQQTLIRTARATWAANGARAEDWQIPLGPTKCPNDACTITGLQRTSESKCLDPACTARDTSVHVRQYHDGTTLTFGFLPNELTIDFADGQGLAAGTWRLDLHDVKECGDEESYQFRFLKADGTQVLAVDLNDPQWAPIPELQNGVDWIRWRNDIGTCAKYYDCAGSDGDIVFTDGPIDKIIIEPRKTDLTYPINHDDSWHLYDIRMRWVGTPQDSEGDVNSAGWAQ